MRRAILVLTLITQLLLGGSPAGAIADELQKVTAFAGMGAYLDWNGGAVHVQIPPRAKNFTFEIRFAPNPGSSFSVQPPNAILLPNAFNLEFRDPKDDESISVLEVPGTAIVRYNPPDLGGRSESTLRMMLLEEDSTTWVEVPSTVDVTAKTVTAQFTRAGSYAVSASNVMPTPVPAAPAPTAVPAPAPAPVPAPAPAPAAPPSFKLGFATLAALIPDVAGQPIENEHYGPNGDSLQRTTTGLMVWRKADNWTAFTNGNMTWINGPFGLQSRPNTDRFDWEAR